MQFRCGIRLDEGSKKWVYQPKGVHKAVDCLSSKIATEQWLEFMEQRTEELQLDGVIMVTIFDDLTLAHILAIMKKFSLVARFKRIVLGFTNLELIWKEKKSTDCDLGVLKDFYKTNCNGEEDEFVNCTGYAKASYKIPTKIQKI